MASFIVGWHRELTINKLPSKVSNKSLKHRALRVLDSF